MDNKPVFQPTWMNNQRNVTLNDALDAYELCRYVPEKNREECYAAYGVDGKNVEKYLHTVEDLNRVFAASGIRESKIWSFNLGKFSVILTKK
jgi:hypothetical protein